jgi:hypothetical protein
MKIPAAAEQLIKINEQNEQLKTAIATTVAAKQIDAEKQQGEALIALIQPLPSRGIDVRA